MGEGMRHRIGGAALLAICAAWLAAVAVPAAAGTTPWRDSLAWRGMTSRMQRDGQAFRLDIVPMKGESRTVEIAPQTMRTHTASALFDGLFALAQQEMREDRVDAIRDDAFDHGKPLPCDCYETGAKWPYVWTRDLSFSADLALARLDPERTKRSLRFKLSDVRTDHVPPGEYVAQDTGSGGSWPISTDRVVWFLAARHLLDDTSFADDTWRALRDTLAQDRAYAFDPHIGLYRGETSFLDWREQTYPAWTKDDVRFIAESFALSTNVLHYEALQLASRLATQRTGTTAAATYREQAAALATAIDARFWNDARGMYMSYIGTAEHPVAYEAYDLLGISLAALSGAVPESRARASLAHYPASEAGSPVVWPQHRDLPIYHNRAIWPFVSAYALRAARRIDSPARIEHEVRSLMRGTALAGSNMENYEFTTQAVHVDDGSLSGPVVNSPRQLWSVAGYLDMVLEGVFGLEPDGTLAPKLPVSLVPMLFGDGDTIELQLDDRRIVLERPAEITGNLLVAAGVDQGDVERHGDTTHVRLRAETVADTPLVLDAPQYAPASPAAPEIVETGDGWRVHAPGKAMLYVDGARRGRIYANTMLTRRETAQCVSVTAVGDDGVESLHGPTRCVGDVVSLSGGWPRRWTPSRTGAFRAWLRYDNPHGPINTGITAAVKWLSIRCEGMDEQRVPVVMPHSVGEQASTSVRFGAVYGQACTFALNEGFNMSDLRQFARYTGGSGGVDGPVNDARIGVLDIMATE